MAEVMYILKSKTVGLNDLRDGLYYIGNSNNIITCLTAVETSPEAKEPEKELAFLINKGWNKIIKKTRTDIITFEKFLDIKINDDIIKYYELTPKEQEDVIKYLYILKEGKCSIGY